MRFASAQEPVSLRKTRGRPGLPARGPHPCPPGAPAQLWETVCHPGAWGGRRVPPSGVGDADLAGGACGGRGCTPGPGPQDPRWRDPVAQPSAFGSRCEQVLLGARRLDSLSWWPRKDHRSPPCAEGGPGPGQRYSERVSPSERGRGASASTAGPEAPTGRRLPAWAPRQTRVEPTLPPLNRNHKPASN